MAGASIQFEAQGFEAVRQKLAQLESLDLSDLADTIGELVEGQTKRRISAERTAPGGSPWAPWSKRYGKTRGGQHSLLRSSGDLEERIQHIVSGTTIEVGTNLRYAAAHQFGFQGKQQVSAHSRTMTKLFGKDIPPRKVQVAAHTRQVTIPARPYLGLSADNLEELSSVVDDWVAAQIGSTT